MTMQPKKPDTAINSFSKGDDLSQKPRRVGLKREVVVVGPLEVSL